MKNKVRPMRLMLPRGLSQSQKAQLKILVMSYDLFPAAGHLQLLNGVWYITHAGLLRIAHQNGCSGIETETVNEFCDPHASRWVIKATVYNGRQRRGFAGYGDADPTNVSPFVRGAEMRVAETRAVNRALRKAYGVGLCSVEELGSSAVHCRNEPDEHSPANCVSSSNNGHDHLAARPLRDRLFAIIRQYELDPALVKRFALDFCGTEFLRQASREKVESFISQLTQAAGGDREALLRRLEQYRDAKEAA